MARRYDVADFPSPSRRKTATPRVGSDANSVSVAEPTRLSSRGGRRSVRDEDHAQAGRDADRTGDELGDVGTIPGTHDCDGALPGQDRYLPTAQNSRFAEPSTVEVDVSIRRRHVNDQVGAILEERTLRTADAR